MKSKANIDMMPNEEGVDIQDGQGVVKNEEDIAAQTTKGCNVTINDDTFNDDNTLNIDNTHTFNNDNTFFDNANDHTMDHELPIEVAPSQVCIYSLSPSHQLTCLGQQVIQCQVSASSSGWASSVFSITLKGKTPV